MLKELQAIEVAANVSIAKANSKEELEKIKIQFLGRERGTLTLILRGLKELPDADRARVGAKANDVRNKIELQLKEKEAALKGSLHEEVLKKERIDVTRPGTKLSRGHLHPITQILKKIEDIFLRMGFTVAEGPEIETEYYNFDALNIPKDHPARDMWDTFWLKPESRIDVDGNADQRGKDVSVNPRQYPRESALLLRTHTSPVQIRYMEKNNPPIRIISPGVVYRYEATDASHDIEFWQIEGLMVDKDISVANFKAVIARFFHELFGDDIEIRLRPSYFPFVEPGFEVDISCLQCRGKGCSVCQRMGWLEMMGAGMVHPAVFKAVGYNPKDVQGFAFGMGLDRIVMMKYKISDVRLMRSGDLRFLNQF